MYLSDIFTIAVNLAGLPAISVPGGFGAGDLPVGLQIIAPHFEEGRIVRAASAFEKATDFHRRKPRI
jgi:aspartyl-tRNA(Asn)/glutamyl-tRNA(Gln) amidotransferase subunit A